MTDSIFLTIREVSERWQVSPATVKRMVDDGTLSCLRARRTLRVSVSSVRAYEEQCKQPKKASPNTADDVAREQSITQARDALRSARNAARLKRFARSFQDT